jgi:hypothetical protein
LEKLDTFESTTRLLNQKALLEQSLVKERGRKRKEGGEAPLLKLIPPSPKGEGG